jgi:hypothetical protein
MDAREHPAPHPPQGCGRRCDHRRNDAPPPLPEYEQPPCPEPNLIWTPGYWHTVLFGFYWVPGAWVPAPYIGALWTPVTGAWLAAAYGFHAGYWGPHIGFYGGVNYGGGYMGIGFAGGTWNGGVFAYNTAVVHVNRTVVTNVYVNTTIVEQTTIVNTTHVSLSTADPTACSISPRPDEQLAAARNAYRPHHLPAAARNRSRGRHQTNLASNNGGHPTNLAVQPSHWQAEAHAAPAGFKPPPARSR